MDNLTGRPAYSTVRAQLRVLEEKGHLRHEEESLRYVYLPKVAHGKMRQSALQYVLETFFEDSPEQVVAALFGTERRISKDQLRQDCEVDRRSAERREAQMIKASVLIALAFVRVERTAAPLGGGASSAVGGRSDARGPSSLSERCSCPRGSRTWRAGRRLFCRSLHRQRPPTGVTMPM